MAWREALAEAGMRESTMESTVSKVKSSMSVEVNLIDVLVMGGGEGVATFDTVVTGGKEAKGEARMARGGMDLRSAFFDTGEEEAGREWVPGFDEAAFVLREDFMVACFFVPEEGSIIVSQADFDWGSQWTLWWLFGGPKA